MCDKLFLLLFFHLKSTQHIFQGINEKMWKQVIDNNLTGGLLPL